MAASQPGTSSSAQIADNRIFLFRLQILIIDGGLTCLRNYVDQELAAQSSTLSTCLANEKKQINRLKGLKGITQVQYDLLYPSSGTVSTSDLDITLIICLMRSLKCFKLNKQIEADICSLKLFRNEICHISTTTGIQHNDFIQKWNAIEQILLRIDQVYPIKDFQQTINDFKCCTLGPNTEKRVEKWNKFDKSVVKELAETIKRTSENSEELKTVNVKIAKIENLFAAEDNYQTRRQGDMLKKMLEAIRNKKLNENETTLLTKTMINSGITLRWPVDWTVVDKHSTGGVGDKVSLVLAPVLAACGLKVPMISGRGLEHTGGTLDKLNSIPDFKVMQEEEDMFRIVKDAGCCIVSQTSQLVPADKMLYRLRDETNTVNEHGLITGSIISKKAVESLHALVLDVKFGKGAFCRTMDIAKALSEKMVNTGNSLGVKTVALITDMNSPLGYTIGNALEVAESIKCLQGEGPEDLNELVEVLGGQLLVSVGKAKCLEEAHDKIKTTLQDGTAIERFVLMLKKQGVQPETANKLCEKATDIFTILPKSKQTKTLNAETEGYVHGIDAMTCGNLAARLGDNRIDPDDAINPAVGLVLLTHIGKQIDKGSPWVEIHYDNELPDDFIHQLQGAIDIRPKTISRQNRFALKIPPDDM